MSHDTGVILTREGEDVRFIIYLGIFGVQPWFRAISHPFYWRFLGLISSTLVAGAQAQGLTGVCEEGGLQGDFRQSCRCIFQDQERETGKNPGV